MVSGQLFIINVLYCEPICMELDSGLCALAMRYLNKLNVYALIINSQEMPDTFVVVRLAIGLVLTSWTVLFLAGLSPVRYCCKTRHGFVRYHAQRRPFCRVHCSTSASRISHAQCVRDHTGGDRDN